LEDDDTIEENVLSSKDEQVKLKRRHKAIIIDSETNEDCNELEMANDGIQDLSSDVEFNRKKIELKNQLRLVHEWPY
jgi:hypothetical protein